MSICHGYIGHYIALFTGLHLTHKIYVGGGAIPTENVANLPVFILLPVDQVRIMSDGPMHAPSIQCNLLVGNKQRLKDINSTSPDPPSIHLDHRQSHQL